VAIITGYFGKHLQKYNFSSENLLKTSYKFPQSQDLPLSVHSLEEWGDHTDAK
jgi:hypothetical protein